MFVSSIGAPQPKQVMDSSSPNKLHTYATKLLREVNNGQPLKPNQKLKITAYSEHLPLVYAMAETAYKDFHSGYVSVELKEKEIEDLKASFGIREDFDYKKQRDAELRQQGAAFITFDRDSSPYGKAGLTQKEATGIIKSICAEIPQEVQNLLAINPEEILKGCLDLRAGQPLSIYGSREHLPQMLELAKWAYQNGARLVEVGVDEKRDFDLAIPLYQYASDAVLNEVPTAVVLRVKEFLEKNVARLYLDGEDPNQYEGINPERIQQRASVVNKAIKEYRDRMTVENPWCVYYLPSTASASGAGYTCLKEAAIEARKINRVGELSEHIARLKEITDKLNALVKQGYRTLHFISVKPNSEIPDGETNLKVSLTPKSIFTSVSEKTPSGQTYIANVPSEESFTTPDSSKTNGTAKITRPVSVYGTVVDGIKMEFKDGKVIKTDATKNKEALLQWLKKNENVDKLGEVSLVAASPIFDLGRIFNSILIDENATCHFALGSAYSSCIEGADSITDQKEKQKYLDELNCNSSVDHLDFMIGGLNVMVFAEKADGSDRKLLIKDNKFQI